MYVIEKIVMGIINCGGGGHGGAGSELDSHDNVLVAGE